MLIELKLQSSKRALICRKDVPGVVYRDKVVTVEVPVEKIVEVLVERIVEVCLPPKIEIFWNKLVDFFPIKECTF